MKSILFTTSIIFVVSLSVFPQRPGGRPGGPPLPPPQNPPLRDGMSPNVQPRGEWMKLLDANNDGAIDTEEFNAAVARTFTEIDRNNDGQIDAAEAPKQFVSRGPRPHGFGPPPNAPGNGKHLLPPFFFELVFRSGNAITRLEFERSVRGVFDSMDSDSDGVLRGGESRPPMKGTGNEKNPPPNVRFIAAEIRYGDKLVKGRPFSADIIIEDTRRLFDGSTVTKTRSGAIYRDDEGRTRREQPLEAIAGFSVLGNDNKPQKLVFINDFATQTQTFLDVNNKIARVHRLSAVQPPREPKEQANLKTESLGTKTIEGVEAQGTRVTFEIPAGELGNDKPLLVTTETWFSNELQMIVMSRHVDPIAGEHIFKLVNIKRSEPSSGLFAVPAGFRVENKLDK
jgi:hypothetical protein